MAQPFPRCFDSYRKYKLWADAARRSTPGKSSYCTDCTVEYQQRMVASQRCSHPRVIFHFDDEGLIEGIRPASTRILRQEAS